MEWPTLRDCQREAVDQYMADRTRKPAWLAMLTPGAGKTIFALYCAAKCKGMGVVSRVAVYVPSDSLRQQWADQAAKFGLHLMPVSDPSDYRDREFDGFVATYAQMNTTGAELAFKAIVDAPTIAILDEVHHLGDSRAWATGTQRALTHAENILMLTGTPWRSDDCDIPWCEYEADPDDASSKRVVVDFSYEYGEAVADGVCRAVEFHSYDAELRYLDVDSEVKQSLRDHGRGRELGRMFSHVFDPDQAWTPGLLARAHELLMDRRKDVPDAGGLVVTDKAETARAIARILADISGQQPTIVVSEDDEAVNKLDAFRADGDKQWIVAIRMVSEGVDVPRLMVGCYLSRWKTPLFFRQYMGRFVRSRKECPADAFDAHVIMPAVSVFMEHAAEVENELRDLSRFDDGEDDGDDEADPHGQGGYGIPAQPGGWDEPAGGSDGCGAGAGAGMGPAQPPGGCGVGDQLGLPFDPPPVVEVTPPEFFRSDLRGIPQASPVYLHGEQKCREKGIPITYARQLADVLAESAPVTMPTPVVYPETPKFKKKRLLRKRVDTVIGKLAAMQAREAGESGAKAVGQRKKAINTELMVRFNVKREYAGLATLRKMEQYLSHAVEKFTGKSEGQSG